jgi:hypothetical protein
MQIVMERIKVQSLHEAVLKKIETGPSVRTDLDIPESVGLPPTQPVSGPRLRDRGRRK